MWYEIVFLLILLKNGERERLKWREKMRDVNVGKRERRGMRMKELERKKESVERERKKNERMRGKHMNGFKV
jgi:hypothetical protein